MRYGVQETIAKLQELKEVVKERWPGRCLKFALGDNCVCPLCCLDEQIVKLRRESDAKGQVSPT